MKPYQLKRFNIRLLCILTPLLTYMLISGIPAKAGMHFKIITNYEPKINRLIAVTPDTALILKECLDLPELQQYFTKNADGTDKQVYVMQTPVKFPVNTSVSKFDKDVLFKLRPEIYSANAETFLIFKVFSVKDQNATVVFNFNYNYKTAPAMLEVTLSLQKTGIQWKITNSQIHRLL